jgi:pyruvate-ferredoxin/flavodoxin oxidoreductase
VATSLPELDPVACSGCGSCWSACPDAALAPAVLGVESLLTAASRLAGTQGKPADALRRSHRQLAGRLGPVLAGAGALTAEMCEEAWEWMAPRMNLSDEERPEYDRSLAATARAVGQLLPAVTRPFFEEPETQAKGTGELLVLAVDPRACLGCGLCVAVCPEDALRPAEREPPRVAAAEWLWTSWEQLPDAAPGTLTRAAEHADVGPMAALLLSRHCAQAQLGDPGSEPGSGERLAARLVSAAVERHAQQRTATLLGEIEAAGAGLTERLRAQLSEGIADAGPDALAQAVAGIGRAHASLGELGRELERLGAKPGFDRQSVLRLARLSGELEDRTQRLAQGPDGLGRARFGVVVASGPSSEWAGRFPHHPYYAPLTVAPLPQAVELASGIARGLAAEHLELVRTLREATLEAKPPPDRGARLESLRSLTWEHLEPEARAACPPLLLLVDARSLLEQGFDALSRALTSELPIKVVLLDGLDRLDSGPEPALVAMAHRRAFVLSGSPACPDHLARGLADALAWPGPALLHLHAPSPSRHGFPADATLARSRQAIEARAHVLFQFDPAADGVFGSRASLEGNLEPEPGASRPGLAEWAAGESRFAGHFHSAPEQGATPLADWLGLSASEQRRRVPVVEVDGSQLAVGERMARAAGQRVAFWEALRELTGAGGPFPDRIRAALEQELEAEHQERLAALKLEYEERIGDVRSTADREAVSRLMDRLTTLAGYVSKSGPGGSGS